MSPKRWQHVKGLLDQALQHRPAARGAFLDQACPADRELRAELESLIAAYDSDPSFIESPAIAAVAAEEIVPSPQPGETARRIGPYQLLHVVASGGMGTVFRAVRADDAYRKDVAIKLIRAEPYADPHRREELARRFRTERQTLANLDHPNVARLLDGGSTEDGEPYLVMEYVEGQSIDAYCDAHRLTTTQRLELFRTVCAAVHYAHQNLVVHRDLKPSNILVTRVGAPKLLDFGIAKLLGPDSSALAGGLTVTAAQPLTPAYASPEQVRGQPVTTASDVYSLGVILYELLTGHRPYRLANLPPHDAARIICEQEPPPPSTVVTRSEPIELDATQSALTPELVSRTREGRPERLRRRLAGDVDMIVLKALRKEPQRRYASVEQFAEDIRRHLAGLPVLARRDTLAYRASKFVRRHRLGVTAAALVFVSLSAGVAGTAWQAWVAGKQRDAAQANLQRAQQAETQAAAEAATARSVSKFLEELFYVADPFQGSSLTRSRGAGVPVGEILERGAQKIAELKDQPAQQAALLHAIGRIYGRLGEHEQAAELLTQALEIRRRLHGEEHADVASTLASLGRVLSDRGEYVEAERTLREALAMRQRLLGPEHGDVAAALNDLAHLAVATGRYDEAEPLVQQALEMYRRLYGDEHEYVAMALGNLIELYRETNRLEQAVRTQQQALELLRRVHGQDHPDVAISLHNLASLLFAQGRYDEAEPLYREALETHLRLLGPEHPETVYTLSNLAATLEGQGRFDQAEELYGQVLERQRRLLGRDHPTVADTLNNLGHLHYVRGRYSDALPLFREALDIRRQRLGEQHAYTALSYHNLASTLNLLGDSDTALELFAKALEIRRTLLGERHPAVAETLNNLGGIRYAQGDFHAAEPLLREALDIRRAAFGPEHPDVAASLNGLGAVLAELGDLPTAEELLREAVAIQRSLWPQGHPTLAGTLTVFGGVLTRAGKAAEAEPLLREALGIRQQAMPAGHWLIANTSSALGACLTTLQRFEEAEPLLLDGYAALQAQRGPRDQRTRQTLDRLIALYEAWGKPERAAEYRALRDAPASP